MGWNNFLLTSLVTSGLFRSNIVLAFQPRRSCAGLKEVFFVEDRIKLVLQSSSSLVSCYSFLETLHQFFHMTIGCMVRRVHP